ncbi:hypothetical protein ACTP13_09185 [Paenibacillus peoriae]|uniref:hypothetical protein n=1 Tax=Paenibacillus peoriae TaxID=59893 RepID=UPI003F94AA58
MFQEWYDSLEGEKKVKADELVEKFTALGCPDPLIWTRSELEENNPSLAEFRFLAFLKKSLTYYDQNQESIVQGLSERGMPLIKNTIRKMVDAGIPQEITLNPFSFSHDGL